jgi:hypothetical protein
VLGILRKNDVALVTLSGSTLDVGCINPEEIKKIIALL